MLDIFLRTCDQTEVHPERGARYINCDKTTLIKKCFISLVDSIKYANNPSIKLWILDDHSSSNLIDFLNTTSINFKIEYEIIELKETGFNYSALTQFKYCRDKGREWVYSVEDDYLHEKDAIGCMLRQAILFREIFNRNIAIRPDDDAFTYSSNTDYSKSPCLVFQGVERSWRTLYNTHNTFLTHVNVFNEYWELFASLAKFFRKTTVNEDGTINTIWSNGVNKNGPVPLFSPLPTLAYHISQGNKPPFGNHELLWNSIKIDI